MTTPRLTAADARRLAGPTLSDKIDALLETIHTRAAGGHHSVRCGYDHKADDDLWVHGGYKPTDEWHEARKQLETLGYTVSFYYNDGTQFVDMYTLIEW